MRALLVDAPDIEMIERNIDEDDRLQRALLERIPVIELEGRVIGELVPDSDALRLSLLNPSTR